MSRNYYLTQLVLTQGLSINHVSTEHNISRSWLYELLKRFKQDGIEGLIPKSRRPHHIANKTKHHMVNLILTTRTTLNKAGFYDGPQSIYDHLEHQGHKNLPCIATIYNILKKHGVITPQKQKRPNSCLKRFEAELPNQRWQSDITHYKLADGTETEILNFIDDHSRLIIDSKAIEQYYNANQIGSHFKKLTKLYGTPTELQTDNGAVYVAKHVKGQTSIETICLEKHVKIIRSRPYHPQTNGKIERYHQTLKKYLNQQTPANTIKELQKQIDTFNHYYNNIRKHRGIKRQTPQHKYNALPHAKPNKNQQATIYRVREDKIDSSGKITIRYHSELKKIQVGRKHKHQKVKILIENNQVTIINQQGKTIGKTKLTKTKKYHTNKLNKKNNYNEGTKNPLSP